MSGDDLTEYLKAAQPCSHDQLQRVFHILLELEERWAELEADKLSVKKSELDLELANSNLELLLNYTYKREIQQLFYSYQCPHCLN